MLYVVFKTMLNSLPLTVFCVVFSYGRCSLTSEYYENLIYENVAKAYSFKLPLSNEEFKLGSESTEIKYFESYDFVIVGAGSSGSVLATRLSEIDNFNILLLEAGGEESDFSQIPAMFFHVQFSEMNWGYYSTPQKNCCLGMKDRRCFVPRGKSIGGCSATNAVMYIRGNPKDYDRWEKLGNPGWSYKDVLPYFMKSENSQVEGNIGYHGYGGLLNTEYSLPNTETFPNFIDASLRVNASIVDYNGADQIGSAEPQLNIKRGKRQSTGTAFLSNVRRRKNIKVLTKALATKIFMNPQKNSVRGVEFIMHNQKFRVNARREVIISGGAINSPQLLMLSGIGPKKHLEQLGIKVIADLPVGQNLLDHPLYTGLAFETNYNLKSFDLKEEINQYLIGRGHLTKAASVNGVGFIDTDDNFDIPTVEYLYQPPSSDSLSILERALNYNDTLIDNYLKKLKPLSTVLFSLILLHQKSKGKVTLKSTDPTDFPNIDLNMFDAEEDVDTFIKGIEFILNLTKTDSFQKLEPRLIEIPICKEFATYTKQFWGCTIRHMASTLFHPCGTTAMGPNKESSVVDHNLKVHGIKKLRVVDAGVFPSTISGHTNAAAIMLAEKIADVIKTEYDTGYRYSYSAKLP